MRWDGIVFDLEHDWFRSSRKANVPDCLVLGIWRRTEKRVEHNMP
jgi:hypothetical protein